MSVPSHLQFRSPKQRKRVFLCVFSFFPFARSPKKSLTSSSRCSYHRFSFLLLINCPIYINLEHTHTVFAIITRCTIFRSEVKTKNCLFFLKWRRRFSVCAFRDDPACVLICLVCVCIIREKKEIEREKNFHNKRSETVIVTDDSPLVCVWPWR